jgi:hypothetical protein
MKINILVRKYSSDSRNLSYSKTRKVADLLEISDIFQRENQRLKKKFKITPEGYSVKSGEDLVKVSDIMCKLGEDFADECKALVKKLNLPPFWYGSMMFLILTNELDPPEKLGFEVLFTSEVGSLEDIFDGPGWKLNRESFIDYQQSLVDEKAILISLRRKMSRAEFNRLVDERWKEIEKAMSKLPKIKTHKMMRIKLAKQIVYLKDVKGKKFPHIANHLADKYEAAGDWEIHDLLTEDYVKNLYHSLKKKIK